MRFVYLSKKNALKNEVMVYAVTDEKIKNINEYFGELADNVVIYDIESEGLGYLPNEIYLDGDTVKNLSEEYKKLNDMMDLEDGEVIRGGKLVIIEKPTGFLKYVFNRELEVWEEQGTEQELKEKYFSIINNYKQIILAQGFDVEISEIAHKQKARDKDVALLTSSIMSLGLLPKEHQVINWAFSDNDITNLTLENLKSMLITGTVFINKVYSAEHTLKMRKPNLNLTIQNFINLL